MWSPMNLKLTQTKQRTRILMMIASQQAHVLHWCPMLPQFSISISVYVQSINVSK